MSTSARPGSDARVPRGALRSANSASNTSGRHVQYTSQQPPSHGLAADEDDVDLERGAPETPGLGSGGAGAGGIFRSHSPSGGSVTSEKPHARHDEYAQGYGRVTPPPPGNAGGGQGGQGGHRPLFARTFTQQFRAASRTGRNGSLSQKEQEAAQKEERRSYFMDTNFKNHLVAALGEFVGTTMFLYFAFSGTAVANIPAGTGGDSTTTVGATGFDTSVQIYIALCFGFSLMVNVWVFYRISGGLFNPAVTLALLLIKAITPIRALFVLTAQLLGGIAAAGLAACMFPTPLNVSTSLAPGVSLAQGVFIEAILTFELVFTIFMLAAEKHRATFVAPVGIGLALFVAELTGVYYTGGSLNPARSLGPCVVSAYFQPEHWIYWVGPFFGSLVAVAFYKVIKLLRYEGVNPGQDSNE